MSLNLGPLAPINPDGSNAPMCQAPGCYRRATKRSRDIPELTWCDDDAGPGDENIYPDGYVPPPPPPPPPIAWYEYPG